MSLGGVRQVRWVLMWSALWLFPPAAGLRAEGAQALPTVDAAASPYVYQSAGPGEEGRVSAQWELGYGSRETRHFTQDGVEQGFRLRVRPWTRIGLELFGGLVMDGALSSRVSQAFSAEVSGRLLTQGSHAVNLDVGAGYIRDYRGDHVPRGRLTLSRSVDRFEFRLTGLLEVPIGNSGRDEADVMTALAASYRPASWWNVGLELAGEDLEGLFESEEAEGGAKLLAGPTWVFCLPWNLYVKANAAVVYAHLENQVSIPGAPTFERWGFMGRAVLGWTFR